MPPALPGVAPSLPVCVIWGAGDPFLDSVAAVREPLVAFLARQVKA